MIFAPHFKELLYLNPPKYRYYAYTGGRGSGKTHHIGRAILMACCNRPGLRVACMRETMESIEESSYQLLVDLIRSEFQGRGFIITATRIYNQNGSKIIFKGLVDKNTSSRENKKGLEGVDIYWIDEAQTITAASLKILKKTIRKTNACLIVSFNRISKKLPVWSSLFLDNPPENTYFKEVNYTDILKLKEHFLDPGWLSDAEEIKERDYEEYKRDYLNDPDANVDAKIVRNWTDENVKPVYYIPSLGMHSLDMHITCDFNLSPNCWLLAHKDDKKVYFFDEFCLDLPTEDLIRVVLDKYPHPGRIIINGDASGDSGRTNGKYTDFKLINNELIRRGYREESQRNTDGKLFRFDIRKANGSRKARFSAWNKKVLDIGGQRCIIADPKCKWLDYNCRELLAIPGTSEFDIPSVSKIRVNPEFKYLGHPFDAASYLVNYYWSIGKDSEEPKQTPISIVKQFKEQGR